MQNKLNLQELWNTQPVPEADQTALARKMEKYKAGGLRKIILLNVMLLATLFLVVFIWLYFQPKLWTTQIGIVLTILPVIMTLIVHNRLIPLYKKSNEGQSNAVYLRDLLEIKRKEHTIQTTIMNVYFILLSVGFGLYLFEYVAMMPLRWGVLFYGIVMIYFGFNWFILRPKIIKKNREKTDGLISQLEKVTSKLSD